MQITELCPYISRKAKSEEFCFPCRNVEENIFHYDEKIEVSSLLELRQNRFVWQQ